MSNTTEHKKAIKVNSLTKVYPLYKSSRDRMKEALSPFRKSYHTDFYALRDVSFEVEKGDSLGIIGQNGSGKSTLLKILSKVLTPTSGTFETSGRVISLLELGSGFNPELTGVENIYFYGTILGFTKKKIEQKYDEILAFADIGQFIYQPLKTYSSGMRSRLAFAVASHVEPDILILDEVLAVGDLRFKQKCYRTMDDLIDQKRTVILVSHNTGAITSFCNKTLWLDQGRVRELGESSEVVKKYIGFMTYGLETKSKQTKSKPKLAPKQKTTENNKLLPDNIKWAETEKLESFGEYGAVITGVAMYFKDTDQIADIVQGGEWVTVFAKLTINENIVSPGLGLKVNDKLGKGVFTVNNYLYNSELPSFESKSEVVIKTDFRFPLLTVGKYTLTVAFTDGDQQEHIQHHWIHDALVITVQNNDPKFKRSANVLVLDDSDYDITIVD
ncbi:MAG TPA: ABC transporter ATP-binding protein [Salinivirgaceae bacterium]|nr:ABC transporter ATP-binding protein [Salinivirgaceae bacterium]HQA75514.1 ABC transporter ATP-binding protein [Salinivirgaceae bacterium]